MTRRWKRFAGASAAALTLVGCSWLTAKGPAAEWDGWTKARRPVEERVLRPGPGPVIVDAVRPTSAQIRWESPWKGAGVVRYGLTPDLALTPASAPAKAGTTAVALAGLRPATRYFFRVEERTPQGVARSSTLSFRTR
jgi:hypothetical protein